MIILLRPDQVPERTEQHSKAPNQARPIHTLSRDFDRFRPERKEESDKRIYKAHNVCYDTPATHSPWTKSDGLFQDTTADD